ncbi:MAG: transketolase family protein [Actinomycetota bacterium]
MGERKMSAATRDAFGEALAEIGATNTHVVVVDGDVLESTRTKKFQELFPDRAWNVGIAESNLVGMGAGLAASGKIPVIASFACFLLCNAYDQIRMSIAFPGLNAKLVGSHGGISAGEDGPSQMAIEDIALASALGGFTVVIPSDANSAKALTKAMIEHVGPVYMRTARPESPEIYATIPDLVLGRSVTVREGDDVTIIACGLMVAEALEAADDLSAQGTQARVIDMHTIKPIDREAIISAATQTGRIVVAEEHFSHGGLGSAVAQVVTEEAPVKMAYVNVGDEYSTSGQPAQLFEKAKITSSDIAKAALSLIG